MSHQSPHQNSTLQQCIQDCQNCGSVCLQTVEHCLKMGGAHVEPSHIQLLLGCAEICQASANFMLRGSEFHGRLCAVCTEICEMCAESCERLGDDEQMRACIDACRRCARTIAEQSQ